MILLFLLCFSFVPECYFCLGFIANSLCSQFKLYFVICCGTWSWNFVFIMLLCFLGIILSHYIFQSFLSAKNLALRFQRVFNEKSFVCVNSYVFWYSKIHLVLLLRFNLVVHFLTYIFIWPWSVTYFCSRIWATWTSSSLTSCTYKSIIDLTAIET